MGKKNSEYAGIASPISKNLKRFSQRVKWAGSYINKVDQLYTLAGKQTPWNRC